MKEPDENCWRERLWIVCLPQRTVIVVLHPTRTLGGSLSAGVGAQTVERNVMRQRVDDFEFGTLDVHLEHHEVGGRHVPPQPAQQVDALDLRGAKVGRW